MAYGFGFNRFASGLSSRGGFISTVKWLATFVLDTLATVGDNITNNSTSVTQAREWNLATGIQINQRAAGQEISEGSRWDGSGYVNNDGSGNKLHPTKTGDNGEDIFLLYDYRQDSEVVNVGDHRYIIGTDNHNYSLTCSTGGTTHSSPPNVATADIGSTVAEGGGTVVWDVDHYYSNIADETTNYQPHILSEKAATNRVLHSQDLSNVAWGGGFASIETDTLDFTAPDGTNTADKCEIATGSTNVGKRQDVTLTGGLGSAAVYVRGGGTATHLRITTNDTAAWNTGVSEKLTLSSDWQRINITDDLLPNSAAETVRFFIGGLDVTGADDSDTFGTLYLWQSDVTEQQTLTSPIPTTTSTVTRAATSFTSTEIIETNFVRCRVADIQPQVYLSDGTNELEYVLSTTTLTFTDGVTTLSTVTALAVGDTIVIDTDTGKLYINGTLKDTDAALDVTWGAITAISNITDIRDDSAIDPTDDTWKEPV